MNNKSIFKFTLLLFINIITIGSLFADGVDSFYVFPKGLYISHEIKNNTIDYEKILYSANAEKISNTWKVSGFSLIEDNLKTGTYNANVSCKIYSPSIKLPGKGPSSKIYLKLNHSLHSESYYDNAYIRVRNVNSQEDYPLYLNSGIIDENVVEYIDLTYHAGSTISLEFGFVSDSSFHGEGWTIEKIEIVANKLPRNNEKKLLTRTPSTTNNNLSKGDLMNNESQKKDTLTITWNGKKLEVLGVQWTSSDEGIVAFNLKDEKDKYVYDSVVSANDFELRLGNQVVDSCNEILYDYDKKVDMIIAVDCSGSMESMQKSLNASIDSLIEKVKEKGYVSRFAEVTFGKKNCYNGCFDNDLSTDYKGNYVAEGDYEYYYTVLKNIADHKYSYSDLSQKVIVMIGDEDTTKNHNGLSQQDVIEALKPNNFQTFIINQEDRGGRCDTNVSERSVCRSSFEKICQATRGKYIVASNKNDACSVSDLTFETDAIVETIGESLNKRYFMKFCLKNSESDDYCGKDIPMSLIIKETGIGDSIDTRVKYLPKIERLTDTQKYDTVSNTFCADTLEIQFRVLNDCETDTVKNIRVAYSFDNDTSCSETIAADTIDTNIWSAKISVPMKLDSSVIHYKILAENSWATISLPTSSDHKKWFDINQNCSSPFCSTVHLSSNPITHSSDSISFELSRDQELFFMLLDKKGNVLKHNESEQIKRSCKKGENKYSLSSIFGSLFEMDYDPLTPYILVVSDGRHTFMSYIYVSRL
ncbi:MAG: hypothetical protein MJZ34_14100 [Paludibacteraceae bacterium]|nr:hypothetical protein [Paludibacteraceae bacterium]